MKLSRYLLFAIAAFAMTSICVSCGKKENVKDSDEKQELSLKNLSQLYGEAINIFIHVERKGGDFGDAVIYDKARIINGKIEGLIKYIDPSADSYTFYAWVDCSGKAYEVEALENGIHIKGITKDDTQKFFISPERNVPTKDFSNMMQEGLAIQLHFQSLSSLMENAQSGLSVVADDGGYVVNMR